MFISYIHTNTNASSSSHIYLSAYNITHKHKERMMNNLIAKMAGPELNKGCGCAGLKTVIE